MWTPAGGDIADDACGPPLPNVCRRAGTAPGLLYIRKPLDANDRPMLAADLAARIKQAVSKLDLSGHGRIDYHLIPADHDRQAYLRNRQAITDHFCPNEAPQLTKQLGFKTYSVTY